MMVEGQARDGERAGGAGAGWLDGREAGARAFGDDAPVQAVACPRLNHPSHAGPDQVYMLEGGRSGRALQRTARLGTSGVRRLAHLLERAIAALSTTLS
jgi:hypothetical protein